MSKTRWTTQLVANEMLKEDCKLLDSYVNGSTRIRYEYHGNEYSVRWHDWNHSIRPSRPHLSGGNRNTRSHNKWNNQKVNELLSKDGCELVSEYHSTKQRLCYRYNGSLYWSTLDDWIHHQSRPHLNVNANENRFRSFLERNGIEFITQKSFDDLKSDSNYVLRFDFYLPSIDLLVEIDDRSHVSINDQIKNGKAKDQYCIEHKLKLLRIDASTDSDDDYLNALDQITNNDVYVMRYGKLYQNYHGSKDI